MSVTQAARVTAAQRELAAGIPGTARRPRVVLAEGHDPRVLQAASTLTELGVCPVLLVPPGHGPGPSGVETLDTAQLAGGAAGAVIAEEAVARSWAPGMREERMRDPVYLAAALLRLGTADAVVAGSTRPSGEVIRAGLHVVGLAPGCGTLSSSFLLRMPDGRKYAFGDCAVLPEPDARQLADIAAATADTYCALTGRAAHIAMLSFSTLGSAEHPSVSVVREATASVRARRPDLAIDGELQFDAALVESVAADKAPHSDVAGRANVFVFPNLAAGNIGYKIAQRLGGAEAFGPILQGLNSPLNDLSRGCSADDVVSVALISALQARRRS